MAWFELARVRTEFFHSLVIPSLTPHPVQSNRQAPRDRDLGDRPTGADIVMESITLTPGRRGSMSAIEDVTPTIGLINQLAASAAAADSSRRQIDNPGAPSANAPRVAGSGVWLLKAAVGSGSSGPLVAPATIDLPGMVS